MKPWMKPLLKRTAQTLGALLALVVSVHLIENWRGARAWKAWQAERVAAGEVRDLNAYAPPAVPDAENFAKAPIIEAAVLGKEGVGAARLLDLPGPKKLNGLEPKVGGDWREGRRLDLQKLKLEDLEAWLLGTEPFLAAWAEAARRPHCRLMADYGDLDAIPTFLGFRTHARIFRQRALVHLQRGRAEAALHDVETVFRVIRHLEAEPHLISQLLRLAMTSLMLQPVWEGLQDQRWNEAQLIRLEAALQGQDLVASLKKSWTYERVGRAQGVQKALAKSIGAGPLAKLFDSWEPSLSERLLANLIPKGWCYQNLVNIERVMYWRLEGPLDPSAHRVLGGPTQTEVQGVTHWMPYTFLADMQTPAFQSQNVRCAQIQTCIDQARVSVALERHRLAHKAYPATLAELVPAYLSVLPNDLLTGEPLHYWLNPDGLYTLYSVGWDRKDDGGVWLTTPSNAMSPGDWRWN